MQRNLIRSTFLAALMSMAAIAHANAVTVDPGQRGEIVWRFTRGGSVEFACLQPGHFEAGMRGAVQVRGNQS